MDRVVYFADSHLQTVQAVSCGSYPVLQPKEVLSEYRVIPSFQVHPEPGIDIQGIERGYQA